MKFQRFLAYLLIGSCIAVVVLFVAALILADISLRNDPWLEADIRIWQAAYDDLAALPDFEYVSVQDDGSFLLHNYGNPDPAVTLPTSIADMLHERNLLGLLKSGDDVFFVTSRAVDDEFGYVISGDSRVDMNGLWHLNRVDGCVYEFSTMK